MLQKVCANDAAVVDRIVVMSKGVVVMDVPPSKLIADRRLLDEYLGV
jgi:ABC-type branched-subunit amino acid transport system ATPase component